MTDRLRPIVDAYLAGGMPPNVALMRLCMEAVSPEQVRGAVQEAGLRCNGASQVSAGALSRLGEGQGGGGVLAGCSEPSPQPSPKRERGPVALRAPDPAARRLSALSALLDQHGSAFATIRAVMAEAQHDRSASSAEETIAHWSAVFDRLAKSQPEAGVALYALGSAELLQAATSEIVEALRGWGLTGGGRDILEIGCGIGRFVRALAPVVAHVTGLDVSREMIVAARQRCAGLPNVLLDVSSGRDLTGLDDSRFDLVLASDVFPYLVQAGAELAARHIVEAGRVLRPGGTLAIFNYSYRGDPSLDRRDLLDAAAGAGFASPEEPRPTFAHWDGAVFLLRKVA